MQPPTAGSLRFPPAPARRLVSVARVSHAVGEILFARRRAAAHAAGVDPGSDIRIDKWLWAARVFKTRSLALEACQAGHVKIGGHTVKPARPVRPGETISARVVSGVTRTLRVVGVSDRRVGPKGVGAFFEDLTPPEELERAKRSLAGQVLSRPKGAGRPTKRERRQMDRFLP